MPLFGKAPQQAQGPGLVTDLKDRERQHELELAAQADSRRRRMLDGEVSQRSGCCDQEQQQADQIEQARQIYNAYYGLGYMMARRSLEERNDRIAIAQSRGSRY